MVIELAAVGRAVVLVEAADAAAVEIAQLAGVADRLAQIEPGIGAHRRSGSPMSRQNARTPMTSATIA